MLDLPIPCSGNTESLGKIEYKNERLRVDSSLLEASIQQLIEHSLIPSPPVLTFTPGTARSIIMAFSKILLVAGLLAARVAAVDLCFFEISDDCNTSDAHLCCNNFPEDRCCFDQGDGFCVETGVFGLVEEVEETDTDATYSFFENNDCTQASAGTCNDEDCCAFLGLDEEGACSGEWAFDEEEKKKKKRSRLARFASAVPGQNCEDPNFAYYLHANGTGRGIHIPKGSLKTAVQYIHEKNYDGLASFEDWNGQRDYD
jgi:hypothetical protein